MRPRCDIHHRPKNFWVGGFRGPLWGGSGHNNPPCRAAMGRGTVWGRPVPRTGLGLPGAIQPQTRSMVEGRRPGTWAWGIGPSTTLRVVPLPTATPQGGLGRPLPPDTRHSAQPTISPAPRIARTRNGGRHRCQPPLSGILPVAARLPSSRSASLAIGGPQNDACGAVRNYPAMVWSAPFRGPAAPGKPFIISSRVCRSSRRPSDGLHFLSRSGPPQLVGIAAFRDQVSVHFLVDPARSSPAGLATCLPAPAVRRLRRPMLGS